MKYVFFRRTASFFNINAVCQMVKDNFQFLKILARIFSVFEIVVFRYDGFHRKDNFLIEVGT